MENLSADKILVVNLGSSEITEDELSDELVEEKIRWRCHCEAPL